MTTGGDFCEGNDEWFNSCDSPCFDRALVLAISKQSGEHDVADRCDRISARHVGFRRYVPLGPR